MITTIDERLVNTRSCTIVGIVKVNKSHFYMYWHESTEMLFGTGKRSARDVREHSQVEVFTTRQLCILIDECNTSVDTIDIPQQVLKLWAIYRPNEADIVKNKFKNQKDLQRYHAKKLKNLI